MNLNELVEYRRSRAWETFEAAGNLAEKGFWNASANRLYYEAFYEVNALLIKNHKSFSSHNGVKTEFHKMFVKTNRISKETGKIYNRLFNLRQEGDYVDFKRLTKDDVFPYIMETKSLLLEIESLFNN